MTHINIFKILIYLLASLLAFAQTTRAEIMLRDYKTLKSSEQFKIYINGVGIGFSWSNSILERRGAQQLYCQPAKLSLGPENYQNILDNEINDTTNLYKPDTPIELILLLGLVRTFPCN